MKRRILSGLSILALTAGLAWASGEPWNTKPYQQWDRKDVEEVLEKSPWVKMQSVVATWEVNRVGMGTQDNQRNPLQPGAAPRPGGEGSGQNDQMSQQAMARFLVRWFSARTIREAVARSALLDNKVSEADAAKFVAQVPPHYEIVVLGSDMNPFQKATGEELKVHSFLEARQSKQKVAASEVTINRSPDGKRVVSVVFSFPKSLPDGKPLFTAKDKNAEFDCKTGPLYLNPRFDLRKMTTKNGLDI